MIRRDMRPSQYLFENGYPAWIASGSEHQCCCVHQRSEFSSAHPFSMSYYAVIEVPSDIVIKRIGQRYSQGRICALLYFAPEKSIQQILHDAFVTFPDAHEQIPDIFGEANKVFPRI